ncbi:hypothetical protein [Methylobacterium sp. R2-1]|uniref:hypothetical protein n=1 Tax=Methylobacterium sp. R2-1 TaxID=2587064 RepID=UPI001613AEDF|nr:hypothetical protein [Methylobacterium sp. R2-1]MBB2963203.1 peptidoglycan hydrolase-like protein with peptidoglycan-binding domain [Methylobacterium sp. R2-1]
MSRITTLALAGLTAASLTVTAVPPAQAAPLPAMNAAQVGGGNTTVDTVGWRRGYYGPRYGYGYGYRRRNIGGALFAGAALGLIGGAIAASAAPRYYGGYYDYGYARPVGYYGGYGYGYPAYGGYYGYGPYGW